MVTRSPRPRPGNQPSSGQHFLKSRRFAAELVAESGIAKSDLVLEIGAGRGKITEELSSRARIVVAVENDPALAILLIGRFRASEVLVVGGDALSFPIPAERFRAFGNIPFAITSALLHRLLDDPATSLDRADLIVQLGAAIKRTRPRHSNLLNLSWGPWWKFSTTRRIPAKAFEPMPSVDAAMLTIVKREIPLLSADERSRYLDFLQRGFGSNRELRIALSGSVSGRSFRRMSNQLAFNLDARGTDLDLNQWLAVYAQFGREEDHSLR